MADTVETKWVYPPGFDGFYESYKVGHRKICVKLTCESDGTGETDIHKVVLADLQTSDGSTPTKVIVERIDYSINGISVTLEWDGATDEVIARLNADAGGGSVEGSMDFTKWGGMVPTVSGGTGDIMLTSEAAGANDTYDITLSLRLK